MNILLTTFFYENIPFQSFYDHMLRWLINNFPQDNINVKFLITHNFYNEAVSNFSIEKYNPILISEDDIKYVFQETNILIPNITHKIIFNTISQDEVSRLKNILIDKIENWTPDIIISQSHISGQNIFGNIYPNALCLSTENAIFSRPPFKRTLSYDPINSVPDNYLTKFAEEIKSFQITEEQNLQVEKLKQSLTGIVNKHNELDDEMMFYYKQKFNKLLLLPLVGDKYITLFKDCLYDTELELVEQVLQNTPKNIGVCVTQADAYASLSLEDLEYFSNKYPNFIYLQKTDTRGYANNSLHYFKYIDAVVNITSKTAFMALLWDKPVLSLAKQYNDWLKDGQGIEELEKVINAPYKNKNNILYWYFTRYVIFEQDFYKENFLYNFIQKMLEKYRKENITIDFFEEINSMDKIFDYIMLPVLRYYNDRSFAKLNYVKREFSNIKTELEISKLELENNKVEHNKLNLKLTEFLKN